jgi:hypothetical protein
MRYVDEVCNLYDCEVLCDIEETEHDPLGVDWTGLRETVTKVEPVIAIGSRAEMGAGLVGFVMTPWFHTLEELDAFCWLHIEKFREIGEKDDEPAPDATGWVIPTLSKMTMKPNPLFKKLNG